MPAKKYKLSPQAWRGRRPRTQHKRAFFKKQSPGLSNLMRHSSPLKRLIILGVFGALLLIIVFSIAVAWISRDLPTTTVLENRQLPASTKIYDRTGEILLYEVYAEQKRTPVSLADLPNYIKWTTIVAEDRSFYSHRGFDIKGFARAVLFNLLNRGQPGGSTISQQFIKNALLSPEKTYTRKIKELILAWQLESKFTKDEILELYFNEIPYGSTAYGIEAAAQLYFNKPARQLSLAEAAILAALPKAPSYYSPYGPHLDELLARKDFIIDAMVAGGYVDEATAQTALQAKIDFRPNRISITAPHFVFYVRELLANKYGEQVVEQGGLKVITSLDLYKQNIAETIITERGKFNEENFAANNAALLALDAKTGEILALVGSRDFFNDEIDGQVNVVLSPNQPGSSFKPIVYAEGFRQGLTPNSVLFDLPTTFKVYPEDYSPRNYNDKYNGPVSVTQALGSSLNIPAVKTVYLVGVDKVLDLAQDFGYTTFSDRSRFGLSITLGGADVTMLDHVAAYAALAREGVYHKPLAILKVEDRYGQVLEEFKPGQVEEKRVLAEQTARLVTSVLTDNNARLLTFQENNYLNFGDRPVAAKTGTTNDFRDAWTLGYTPSLAVGVWVGNTDNSAMKGAAAGGALAAPIWRGFMQQVLGDTPIEDFKEPESSLTSNKPMLNGQLSFSSAVEIDSMSGLLATEYTPKTTLLKNSYGQIHNILHYVQPGNIMGPVPNEPWSETNYTNWELPVEEWAQQNNISNASAPTEFDNIHLKPDQPNLVIHQLPSQVIGLEFSVNLSAAAPRGIRRIEYVIDKTNILTENFSDTQSIELKNTQLKLPSGITSGIHRLTISVYDDLENDTDIVQSINITR